METNLGNLEEFDELNAMRLNPGRLFSSDHPDMDNVLSWILQDTKNFYHHCLLAAKSALPLDASAMATRIMS